MFDFFVRHGISNENILCMIIHAPGQSRAHEKLQVNKSFLAHQKLCFQLTFWMAYKTLCS